MSPLESPEFISMTTGSLSTRYKTQWQFLTRDTPYLQAANTMENAAAKPPEKKNAALGPMGTDGTKQTTRATAEKKLAISKP